MKIFFLILISLNFLFGQIDLNTTSTKISVMDKKTVKIDIGNLKIGQTGVIVNNYMENEAIIIATATVISSADNSSILTYKHNDLFKQDAIPTTKLQPKDGDSLILNHLYNTSLLIVPNSEFKKLVLNNYDKQQFISEDFFASYLKLNNNPIPTKSDIIKFCQKQQIGTIFIVVNKYLYILDAYSFKILDTIELNGNSNVTVVPFFSKIEEIEKGFWDFGEDKISDYNRYYSELLELKK